VRHYRLVTLLAVLPWIGYIAGFVLSRMSRFVSLMRYQGRALVCSFTSGVLV
jgi:hypothetical protein